MRDQRVVIIGAGFAGAATAYHLSLRGFKNVVILERERLAGLHASGRNAAMVRQVVPQASIAALAREGCAFIRRWASRQSAPVYKETGSLLLYSDPIDTNLAARSKESCAAGVCVVNLSRAEVIERVPILANATFDAAIWCPSDGVVDISSLLSYYLSESQKMGAQLVTNAAVSGFETREGRVVAVCTRNQKFTCDIVVNAAGVWVNEIADLAHARRLSVKSYRRHLFLSQPMPHIDSKWPFVWNVSKHVYFRPENPGLLLSPCDNQYETTPGVLAIDERALDLLAEKLMQWLPSLSTIAIAKAWAGLRTIADDDHFVVGWDTIVGGLFWVAGLGGHGVTCSASVGSLAVELMQKCDMETSFSPTRFSP